MRISVKPKDFMLLHGTFLLYSLVNLFAKLAGLRLAAGEQNAALLFVALEFFILLVYTLLWQLVLKRMSLNVAYSNKAICTLWTFLLGVLLFGEALTWGKAVGIVVVLAGVLLVVTDHD